MKKFNFKLTKQQEKDFDAWIEDGNVIKNQDGSYSTQDAQYRNRLKDMDALKEYFYKEFLSQYKYGGISGSETLTKPRTSPNPTINPNPTIRPARPSEDNPYKPKIAPRPKASKYDFVFMNKK
jgi:hypothetical protein